MKRDEKQEQGRALIDVLKKDWMLSGAGRSLLGKEAERLAELGRRVLEEQQLFLKSMWTVPAGASITYNYIDPRADAQLKV